MLLVLVSNVHLVPVWPAGVSDDLHPPVRHLLAVLAGSVLAV